jgi:hypothetical protein
MELKHYYHLVEEALREYGVNVDAARVEGQEGHWVFSKGSALVSVEVFEIPEQQQGHLLITSPVMDIPKERLLELATELLTLNGTLTQAAFFFYQGKVMLKSDRPLAGLDKIEVVHMLERLAFYADSLDNYLVEKYYGNIK